MCTMSRAGWLLAQALRVIGAPLPLARQIGLPAVVTVTEDHASGGQNWTRVYARASGFPQVIHSTKRFSGSTGLEEYIGHGIRMALTLSVENGTLVFTSAGYFIDCGGFCFRLPRWLAPGKTVVTHRETTGNEFLLHARTFASIVRDADPPGSSLFGGASMLRRIVLIGATGFFGRRLAEHLAAIDGIELVLTSRDDVRARSVAQAIGDTHPNAKIDAMAFDRG